MIIKKAVYKKKRVVQLIKISEAVYGCDNCKKKMNEHRHDLTVFYHKDSEAKNLQFCSWKCVIEFIPKIKTDYFISLPFVSYDHSQPGFTIKDFLKAINSNP